MTKKSNPTITVALLGRLQMLSAAAWLIDVARSRVVWTNQAGASRLDPDGTGEPRGGWLNRDMPAMQSLIAIRRSASLAHSTITDKGDHGPDHEHDQEQSQELIFQTPSGTLRQQCLISFVAPPTSNLALVISQDNERAGCGNKPAPPALIAAHQIPKEARLYANAARTSTPHANNNTPPEATGADARALQEIARRIRETPVGLGASPFSLEALHAAASQRNQPPKKTQAPSTRNPPRGDEAAPGTRRPTIVNFRQAALAFANQNNTLPADQRAANVDHVASAEPTGDSAPGHSTLEIANGLDAKYSAKLAHELRTPISAIHSAADLLAREQFGPIGSKRYKGYAQDIRQSAAHALSVIEAMLDPSALATGKQHIKPIELDLTQLIKTTISGIKPLARTANIKLVERLHKNLPPVLADARNVRQILLNLLTNAINYTPPGGRITITTNFESTGTVRVEVLDTGPGMSRDNILAVLNNAGVTGANPQHRLNPTSSQNKPTFAGSTGHGFGLPMVMTLARANGAKFELSSAKGEGLAASLIFRTISVACAR